MHCHKLELYNFIQLGFVFFYSLKGNTSADANMEFLGFLGNTNSGYIIRE